MEYKSECKINIIKITFLEIIPPINEIVKPKEELNIVFQGNDNFYDFKKYLSSKNPILLHYNKKSLIMTLLKNNNIFATGFFSIRQGEQNIFFNYENNKNISNKILKINNLSECLKMKIFCECENLSTVSTLNRNTISTNYENNDNKYVTKVNLMKPIRINNYKKKNNNQKIYDKKKRILSQIHQTNNNSIKKNFVNNSQEFGANYTAILTEEKNSNNNIVNNDIKKFSKIINNTARKNEPGNYKNFNTINKAKSKNYLSSNAKQNKSNKHIKMNNSSLNIINQNNKFNSNDNFQNSNNNKNYYSNRNSLKSNISINKISNRNSNKQNLNNKNMKTSLNNYISGKIIEHVGNEKINYISINKSINKNSFYSKNINDTKKLKSNNITMNSISTTFTKKNELEFSMNSLQDGEDKNYLNFNLSNKNTLRPLTNRINNTKLSQQLSGIKNNEIQNKNSNYAKHKYNKSLGQQSFTEKIFCENNDLELNLTEKKENLNLNLCKSENKLEVDLNETNKNTNNNINNINKNDLYNEKENEFLLENNNYIKLKEDFNLLYNLEYISKINEDLLKLELELFIEKMSDLFSEYHNQMDEMILEKRINNQEYKIYFNKYLLYNKLNDKLENTKKKYNKDKNIIINIREQNDKNVETNFNELDIFKIIFPDLIGKNNEDKKKQLKNILSIILKNKENKELIKEKYDKYEKFLFDYS